MGKVFISYSRVDNQFARKIAVELSKHGFDVWLDVEDIPTGMNWSNAIQEGLDTADSMIVILSPEAMASKNVEDEWQYFLDYGKPLIPILLRQTKMHFQLHRMQYINFVDTPFASATDKLLQELEARGIHAQQNHVSGLAEREDRGPTKDSLSVNNRARVLTVLIVLIVALALVSVVVLNNVAGTNTVEPTQTVTFVYFPIRQTESLEANLPYEVNMTGVFADVSFSDIPIHFDVLGMDRIEGTVDFVIPPDAMISTSITGTVPISESIPINLDAELGFIDETDTVTVIARLNVNDSIPINLNISMQTNTEALFEDDVVVDGITTTLQLTDGTFSEGELALIFPEGLIIPIVVDLTIPLDQTIPVTLNVTNTTQFSRDRVPTNIQVSDVIPIEFSVPIETETTIVLPEDTPVDVTARFEPYDGSSALEGVISLTFPQGLQFSVTARGIVEGNVEMPITISIPTSPEGASE